MSNSTTANSGGIGVLGLLGVVFVTLKLIGIIDRPGVRVEGTVMQQTEA